MATHGGSAGWLIRFSHFLEIFSGYFDKLSINFNLRNKPKNGLKTWNQIMAL
jgi:hypothetical protein